MCTEKSSGQDSNIVISDMSLYPMLYPKFTVPSGRLVECKEHFTCAIGPDEIAKLFMASWGRSAIGVCVTQRLVFI